MKVLDALDALDVPDALDVLDALDTFDALDMLDAFDALDVLDAIDALDALMFLNKGNIIDKDQLYVYRDRQVNASCDIGLRAEGQCHRKHLLDDLCIQLILSIIFPLFKSFHVVNYGQLCFYCHVDIPPSLMVLFVFVFVICVLLHGDNVRKYFKFCEFLSPLFSSFIPHFFLLVTKVLYQYVLPPQFVLASVSS